MCCPLTMLLRPGLILLITITTVLGVATLGPSESIAQVPGSDAFIFDAIDTLRPIATAISVDGLDSDWGVIPSFSDPVGDVGTPSLDIVEGAIAALDQEVLLRLRTSASPSLAPYAFSFLLDLGGNPAPQIQFLLDPVGGAHLLNILDDQTSAILSTVPIPGLTVSFGADTIEVSALYSVLTPLLPTSLANEIQSANHRPWVRAISLSTAGGAPVDRGPSAASYRLIATPYDLDPGLPASLPNVGSTPFELEFPLAGEWLLAQGADGSFSHNNCWCYDFIQIDPQFSPSDPPESLNNSDYFAWGQTVTAPIAGTVTTATGGNPDDVPGTPSGTNNVVSITNGAFVVNLFHFMQSSLTVSVSDVVSVGNSVGLVGNSGFSVQPHLHLQARSGGSTRPIAMAVAIRLNPTPDIWERQISAWQPREGFLVERQVAAQSVPTSGRASQILLLLALGLVVLFTANANILARSQNFTTNKPGSS